MKTLLPLLAFACLAGASVAQPRLQPPAAAKLSASAIAVTDAWARPALSGGTGGAYMTLRNTSGRALHIVGASTPVARAAEVHESMLHDQASRMQMRTDIELAPGQQIAFAPGGLHVMLVGLRKALAAGDTVRLTLRVAAAPNTPAIDVPVLVQVRRP